MRKYGLQPTSIFAIQGDLLGGSAFNEAVKEWRNLRMFGIGKVRSETADRGYREISKVLLNVPQHEVCVVLARTSKSAKREPFGRTVVQLSNRLGIQPSLLVTYILYRR